MTRTLLPAVLALAACFGGDDPPEIRRDTDEDPVFAGTANITPNPLTIRAPVGERTVGTVQVENVGEYPLDIASAVLSDDAGGVLVTDEATNADRTISPERRFDILVVCTLPDATPVQGVLTITTNDVDAPVTDVPVTCTPPEGDTDDTDG